MVSSDSLESKLRAMAPLGGVEDGPGEAVVLEAISDSTGLSAGVLGRSFVLHTKRCEVSIIPAEADKPYLNVLCSPAPLFALSGLALSPDGSLLAICGPLGVACISVAALDGSGLDHKASRRPAILLDFASRPGAPRATIARVLWLSNTSLLVLASDNSAHTYLCSLAALDPGRVVSRPLAPPLSLRPPPSRQEEALREFPIDAAAVPDPSGGEARGLLFLLGSGEVLWSAGCESAEVQGPLRWSPPASDNYGCDFCAALCLNAGPLRILVAGTTSGQLFHCLLLRPSAAGPPALAVFDAVDLSLRPPAARQLRLRADPLVPHRYFALHSDGVHTVHLGWLPELAALHEADGSPNEAQLSKLPASLVEHALSLRPVASGASGPGLATFLQLGPSANSELLCVLRDGDIARCRVRTPLPAASTAVADVRSSEPAVPKTVSNDELVQQMRRLLTADTFQPLLRGSRAGGEGPGPKECLDLVQKAGATLAAQYLQPLDCARALLSRRLEVLEARRVAHMAQLAALETEQRAAAATAEGQLDRVAAALARADRLRERLSGLSSRLANVLPRRVTRAEEKAAEEARRLQARVASLQQWLERTADKREYCARVVGSGRRRQHQLTGTGSQGMQMAVTKQLHGVLKDEGQRIGELISQLHGLQEKVGVTL